MDFAVRLGNGTILSSAYSAKPVLGSDLTAEQFNKWRAGLDVYHHAELFRLLNELRVFCGEDVPHYPSVQDNPYVMLRLGKGLAHVAQWAESQLTLYQAGGVKGDSLHPKLSNDSDFDSFANVAGKDANGTNFFPGKSVKGTAVDTELRTLLSDIQMQSASDERGWRVLRVLYLIRNSTAHQIETGLNFYSDRQYILDLVQVTFVAALLIEKCKGKAIV